VETGADVPGYSGGFAACAGVSDPDFCSRGSLTPVAAPNASPNVFLARGRLRRSGFGAIVLRDVARGPSGETGADVPGYSGGFAACAAVSDPDFL
jgi:hypothetical protein